ncbi:hypothetical protein EYC80_000697 [Monilinia laxa]|uniref:Uncharacterized protein n=1 Tax=Monilinia laxa TaxID=61186 RepID=A0A5N6KBG5_MONLA|nr:hypothetical protein EYC80_000697 [Monilinia laxa]
MLKSSGSNGLQAAKLQAEQAFNLCIADFEDSIASNDGVTLYMLARILIVPEQSANHTHDTAGLTMDGSYNSVPSTNIPFIKITDPPGNGMASHMADSQASINEDDAEQENDADYLDTEKG